MSENLDFVLQILRVDIFIAFGLYSILYAIISLFIKSPILKIIDYYANRIVIYSGLIFLLVWISLIISTYSQSSEELRTGMINRMFGPYWFGYWLQPILWILLTQLLRFESIQRGRFLRIIFSIIFMISIEQFVIIITSFHRDYLPSSWYILNSFDISFTPLDIVLGIITKVLLFLTFVGIYYLIDQKIKAQKVKANQ